MLFIIIILILLVTSLVLFLIRLLRPNFPYMWLIGATTTTLAWLLVLLSRWLYSDSLPVVIPIVTWQPEILFPISPTLIIDNISWIMALSVVSLASASILTDVGRQDNGVDRQRPGWSANLSLSAFALLAVLSENLLTILLAWAAIDLVELVIWIPRSSKSGYRITIEAVILNYSLRTAGILVVIAAGLVANAFDSWVNLPLSNPQIGLLLVMACCLRLGVIPAIVPLSTSEPRKGLDVLLRLTPAAASLAILPRITLVNTPSTFSILVMILAFMALIYGCLAWLTSPTAQQAGAYWVMSAASLAVIAVFRGEPAASLAWTVSLLLAGGLILLYHSHHRRLTPLMLIAAFGLSMLPYSLSWFGVWVYGTPPTGFDILLLLFQSLLIVGYLLHTLKPEPKLDRAERWIWLIYPTGLTILVISNLGLGWLSAQSANSFTPELPTWLETWPALASGILILLLLLLSRRRHLLEGPVTEVIANSFQRVFSFRWLFGIIRAIYSALRNISSWLSLLLEGQAGILWTLLLLALLLSLITQVQFGG